MKAYRDFDTVSVNGQKEKILVSVRLRPLSDNERSRNEVCDWECINNSTVIYKGSNPDRAMLPSAYTFDRVFGCGCPTEQVYTEGAKEVVLSAVSGINSSIFAYGQTSSGKTYTMSGITEYAVSDIYDYIEKHQERDYILKFSAMEIYNEAVRDLLSLDSTPLRLLDDPERGTVVERLTEEMLQDWNHFLDLLAVCEAQRHIGETSMNQMSSRSHQILRLTIESSAREYQYHHLGARNSSTLTASVNFVDLAGSERASQTLSAGTRLKEGCHINRSLLTLGTVIRKLSSKGGKGHVPYRNSKLTRILHNSLGGNARTAIICTMSPARMHVEQSRNTLLFASCAKEVTMNAQVNVVMSGKVLVKQLQRELARMENELRSFRTSSPTGSCDSSTVLREKELRIEVMEKEIKELTQQLDHAQSRIQDLLLLTTETQRLEPGTVKAENQDKYYGRVDSSNSNLDFADNAEEEFLLDGTSLKLPRMYSKIVAPDVLSGWDITAPKIQESSRNDDPNDDTEVMCKDVPCITVVESRPSIFYQKEQMVRKSEEDQNEDIKEENPKCPEKMGAESGDINYEATYDSMNKKIQDVQSTINCFVSLYPTADQSPPTSPNVDAVNTISMNIMRSRSSRTMLMGVPPYSISKASDLGFSGNLETPPLEFQDDFKKTWRKDFPISMQKVNEIAPNNQKPELEKYGPIVKVEPYDWEMEFRKKQRKIIKLWQACCVPLQHRTYFFLLFKGDSSDAVYMEVELRRLSFLRGTYISQSLELASSLKALNKEREILGKRILKMFRRHEREILYRAWNIGLDTKQRSQQLARKLWTDTRDMAHVEASAGLISRLVDWSQTGLVRKEMFGLNFSPQPLLARRFNFGWQFSMSSLSFAASQA